MESRNAGLTYTILSRIETWLVFALAAPIEINRIVGINEHKDGPTRDAEAARLERLAASTRAEFDFLDSRAAYVAVVRLVDLLSADGIWDGVHKRAAPPEGFRLRPGACRSGPLGAPCAACAVDACDLPEQHDAALARLQSCACRACAAGRGLLARVPIQIEDFAARCRARRNDASRARPVAPAAV